MTNFFNATLRNSKAFRQDTTCKDMALLEPGTRAAVVALMGEAKELGHDLRLLETYRSQTRQSALFMKRATKLRTVGTHGYGIAVDFGVFIDGKYAEKAEPYRFLRGLARKHGLICGQDWGHPSLNSFDDSGHVQRCPVWRQNELFAGAWYPPEVYDPYTDSVAHGHKDVTMAFVGAGQLPAEKTPEPVWQSVSGLRPAEVASLAYLDSATWWPFAFG